MNLVRSSNAGIAQLGERQTEDLKVPGSIPGHGSIFFFIITHTCIANDDGNMGCLYNNSWLRGVVVITSA